MLLQVRDLGEKDGARLYHCQTYTGLQGIVQLTGGHGDLEIDLLLIGTYYRRTYPASGPVHGAPAILDLECGYQTVSTFLQTWECSSPEQRELLQEPDGGISWSSFDAKKGRDVRTKTKLRLSEDRPRAIPGRDTGDCWRVLAADLRAALKGTLGADLIRIGGVTIKRSVLADLVSTKSALTRDPILELRYVDGDRVGGALEIRSADGRARVTVRHGAGDKHHGRYGWSRRIVLQPA